MIGKVAAATFRSSVVSELGGRLVNPSLRTLSFHTVDNPRAFDRQMAWLAQNFTPVNSEAVARSMKERSPLPARAVWVTFDDGSPTVVDHGLSILRRYEIPATMFVCPGLIESGESFWWDIALAATRTQLAEAGDRDLGQGQPAVDMLKRMPDDERRHILAQLPDPAPETRRQLELDDVQRWIDAGHTVGNHSWDHPCLDMASEEEQLRQFESAHVWLVNHVEQWCPIFAYPNGNWSPVIEPRLMDLGYQLAVLHDHRMSSLANGPLRVSRLHTESEDDLSRFRSVVAGTQPTLQSLTTRLRSINR